MIDLLHCICDRGGHDVMDILRSHLQLTPRHGHGDVCRAFMLASRRWNLTGLRLFENTVVPIVIRPYERLGNTHRYWRTADGVVRYVYNVHAYNAQFVGTDSSSTEVGRVTGELKIQPDERIHLTTRRRGSRSGDATLVVALLKTKNDEECVIVREYELSEKGHASGGAGLYRAIQWKNVLS
jgi:hypothetical protein